MKDSNPHNTISWNTPVWEKVPGLNAPAIDTKLLK